MITTAIPKLPFIDKQTTLNFYLNQLGCELLADYGDYFMLHMGKAELHFFAYPTIQPAKSDFMIYLRIDSDIDTLYARYKNNKQPLERLGKLEIKPWGQKEFTLIDPNGTLLTFGQAI